jgi:hypothetical protein
VGGDEMRKIQGINNLIPYLDSISFPLTREEIQDLIAQKKLPHKKPVSGIFIFDLDHIDWWVNENRIKE